eukprot:TRINITY_DN7906_c0_g1_i4.p1 TRINITY_DN7906_c0_g1~~TRINITY_DN7906_c0_g1_i4.p1  ORF type:complete len:375 (-),score=70.08 TRINITY_DN7906_c0_g1_i4:23-1147(-)
MTAQELGAIKNKVYRETCELFDHITSIQDDLDFKPKVFQLLQAFKDSITDMTQDKFSTVPKDIILLIIGLCGERSCYNLSQVSKRFASFFNDEFWRNRSLVIWNKKFKDEPQMDLDWVKKTTETMVRLNWLKMALLLSNQDKKGLAHITFTNSIEFGQYADRKLLKNDRFRLYFGQDRKKNLDNILQIQTGEFITDGEGYGAIRWRNGDYFEGNIKKWMRNGPGKFLFPNGQAYDGDFCDEDYHGKGKLTLQNGVVYEGQWEKGSKHGQGTMTWPGGFSYSGGWDVNVPIDYNNAIAPAIKKCISEKKCTVSLTEAMPLPQMLFQCSVCQVKICDSCLKRKCHKCNGTTSRVWQPYSGSCKAECNGNHLERKSF